MTQNFDVFAKRKGQSAIEYLMTYGWMLLVVAIVGGAIFATVQGQCTQSSSGFSTADVRVADFGITADNNMALELRNGAADPITVTDVNVSGTGGDVIAGSDKDLNVGASEVITVDNTSGAFSNAEGCNTFDLTVQYNVTDGIDNQVVTGTLTDSMQITKS